MMAFDIEMSIKQGSSSGIALCFQNESSDVRLSNGLFYTNFAEAKPGLQT
jgi:hypothetical protein